MRFPCTWVLLARGAPVPGVHDTPGRAGPGPHTGSGFRKRAGPFSRGDSGHWSVRSLRTAVGTTCARIKGRAWPCVLLATLVPVILPSFAESADVDAPSYGSQERFVLDMEDARSGDCAAEPVTGYRFLFRCDEGRPRLENLRPYMQLPIRVGRSWTHDFRDVLGGQRWTVAVEVTGREQVTVPAGSYDTYRLEMEERRTGADSGTEQI